jgi:hypothetical protein
MIHDSMGVAVEVSISGANKNDISDIENDTDFSSPAEVNVARCRVPSMPLETLNAQFAGTQRNAAAIALDAVVPIIAAFINEVPPMRRPSADTSAENEDAHTHAPWLVETLAAQFYGPPRHDITTADRALAPHNTAFIGVASTSRLNASTPVAVSTDFAQSAAD